MNTKYNIGDTLWKFIVYSDYETVIIKECRVFNIRINEHHHVLYICDVDGYQARSEYLETELYPDKEAAITAAEEYCHQCIGLLEHTIAELRVRKD